jgi:hypothetical protein
MTMRCAAIIFCILTVIAIAILIGMAFAANGRVLYCQLLSQEPHGIHLDYAPPQE